MYLLFSMSIKLNKVNNHCFVIYSKVYRVQTVNHENLDSQYIDGVKMIYVQIDSTSRIQAVCDYKTKKGAVSGIKCAGAAEITFQVQNITF